jgi:2-(1,2-epoxy-1,2-dihydrophenyl)acetyl-CoA isomerase
MAYHHIHFHSADGIARLTLSRPERLNSFNDAMHAEVREALGKVRGDASARVLLLTGAGRGFCAGQDLAEPGLTGPDADLRGVIERGWNRLIRTMRRLPKPVVCAVHGMAAGAGASIAFAADLTLAAEDARFIQAFVKIGLVPDSGATWTLPRLAGPQRARGLAMLGDSITGAEAADWGLVWRAVPAAQLQEEAHALCARLARLPAQALAAIKLAMDAAEGQDLNASLALEADLQARLGRTEDYAEGVAAFQQKRTARFAGAPE